MDSQEDCGSWQR